MSLLLVAMLVVGSQRFQAKPYLVVGIHQARHASVCSASCCGCQRTFTCVVSDESKTTGSTRQMITSCSATCDSLSCPLNIALYTSSIESDAHPISLPHQAFKAVPQGRSLASHASVPELVSVRTEEMLAIILQNIFEYMLCIVVLSDSSWTIILIDIVCSDQVCVYYMLHHVKGRGGGRLVSAYLVSLGQYCVLASHEQSQQYWHFFVSESKASSTSRKTSICSS